MIGVHAETQKESKHRAL